jgi:hypothetical protein
MAIRYFTGRKTDVQTDYCVFSVEFVLCGRDVGLLSMVEDVAQYQYNRGKNVAHEISVDEVRAICGEPVK